jgi:hypothetical protein
MATTEPSGEEIVLSICAPASNEEETIEPVVRHWVDVLTENKVRGAGWIRYAFHYASPDFVCPDNDPNRCQSACPEPSAWSQTTAVIDMDGRRAILVRESAAENDKNKAVRAPTKLRPTRAGVTVAQPACSKVALFGPKGEPRELEGGAGGDGARDAAASDAQDAAAGSLAP